MLERSSNSPQARSKAQQAAEKRPTREDIEAMWSPSLVRKYPERALDVMTRLAALPENPDPAVIEAMATAYPAAYQRAVQNASKGPDGISREQAHQCYVQAMTAAYAALRGAMQ